MPRICKIFEITFEQGKVSTKLENTIFFPCRLLHCKCFDHKNYGDWKLRALCRENLHYLWKRAVRIFPCNYSPFPQIVQIFPAGTLQFLVPVVFMVKKVAVYHHFFPRTKMSLFFFSSEIQHKGLIESRYALSIPIRV